MMIDMKNSFLEAVLDVSKILTGIKTLPPQLAKEYIERFSNTTMNTAFIRLIKMFEEDNQMVSKDENWFNNKFLEDNELRIVAQQLVFLWYSSALMDDPVAPKPNLIFGKPEHHFQALLWETIGAHPPGISGGYFGYWHYTPEN